MKSQRTRNPELKLEKRTVIITEPLHRRGPKGDKVKAGARSLLDELPTINRQLGDTIAILEEEYGFAFRPLHLVFDTQPTANTSVATLLARISEMDTVRGLANFGAIRLEDEKADLATTAVSHLVSITSTTGKQGWRSIEGLSDAVVNTSPELVSSLIVDILLDISMFYSWAYCRRHIAPSLDEKRKFSQAKVQFAIQKNLTSYYGPIHDTSLSYVSLASLVRSGNRFSRRDCRAYEELWKELMGEVILEREALPPDRYLTRPEIREYILGSLTSTGHISMRGLDKLILPLEPGDYVFVRVRRRAGPARRRQQLLYLFGGAEYRVGKMRVVRRDQLVHYVRHSDFLTFVPFRFVEP